MIARLRGSFFSREIASSHAAAFILGGAALLSKLLGLIRDRLLAARFGAGPELDSYYAAFQIPDLLFTIFLLGAASAAVLPVFLVYEKKNPREAEDFISNLLGVFSAFAAVAVLAAIAFAPFLARIVAPGFSGAELGTVIRLTRIMLLGTVFLSIAGIISSMLQARHRFFVFALPPIFYNLGIIGGIVLFVPLAGTTGLAYGVVLGALLQVCSQLPALWAMRFRFRPAFDLSDAGLRSVLKTSLPRVAALSMSQITLVALSAIASFFAAGSLSAFKLATNLFYVPVGLFGVSYALAMFPKLSGAHLEGRAEHFAEHLEVGARNILLWSMPFAALLIVLRAHIVRVVLGSGVFDWQDTRIVAATLAVLAVAVVSESILPLVLRAFYALGRTREPLFWDILGSLITVGGALAFSAWFASRPEVLHRLAEVIRIGDLPSPRILGIALGFAAGSLINAILLSFALARAARRRFGRKLGLHFGSIAAMLAAAVLAGVAAYVTLLPFPNILSTRTFAGIFLQGTGAGIAGMAVYIFLLAFRKNPEILGFIETLRGRVLGVSRAPRIFEIEKVDGDGSK